MRYAVIDISASSLSLLIADINGELKVQFTDRETLSVLHYAENGTLSLRGIRKIADGLKRLKNVAIKYGAEKCYVISTASVRNFKNYEEVEAALKEFAGVELNLLSGEEEAFCDLTANSGAPEKSLLVDIGGGSIEVCDPAGTGSSAFLDFGTIGLKRKFVRHTHPSEEEAVRIRRHVKKSLAKLGFGTPGEYESALLLGPVDHAIAEMYADRYGIKGESVELEYDKLKKLRNFLLTSSKRSLLIVKIAPERMNTFVTSVVALCAVLKYYGIERAVRSPYGVKEGYLLLVAKGGREDKETPLTAPAPAPAETEQESAQETAQESTDENTQENTQEIVEKSTKDSENS